MNLYVISGATGMTGSELSRKLVGDGHRVVGFDNFFASSIDTVSDVIGNPLFDFFELDIRNMSGLAVVQEVVSSRAETCDAVYYVNCAAVVHTEHFYHVNRTFDTNVLGMRAFLEQAVEVGAHAFVNCSTSEVYSMQSWRDGGVREDDFILMSTAEHSQRTSYATGKLMTEFFLRDAVESGLIKGCSIRFANVYSKNELYPKHIIPHIVTSLREHGEVTLLENSRRNRRTFLHNEDSCDAVMALMATDFALDGSVYNVATDEEIAIVDLVGLCARRMGIESPVIRFEGYRESDPERRLLNTDKIRARTGWRPRITLERGIDMLLEELR